MDRAKELYTSRPSFFQPICGSSLKKREASFVLVLRGTDEGVGESGEHGLAQLEQRRLWRLGEVRVVGTTAAAKLDERMTGSMAMARRQCMVAMSQSRCSTASASSESDDLSSATFRAHSAACAIRLRSSSSIRTRSEMRLATEAEAWSRRSSTAASSWTSCTCGVSEAIERRASATTGSDSSNRDTSSSSSSEEWRESSASAWTIDERLVSCATSGKGEGGVGGHLVRRARRRMMECSADGSDGPGAEPTAFMACTLQWRCREMQLVVEEAERRGGKGQQSVVRVGPSFFCCCVGSVLGSSWRAQWSSRAVEVEDAPCCLILADFDFGRAALRRFAFATDSSLFHRLGFHHPSASFDRRCF